MAHTDILSQHISLFVKLYPPEEYSIRYGILDWGLGHASRSIAIIRELQKKSYTITVYTDSLAYDLVRNELPGVSLIRSSPYGVKYYFDSIFVNILLQAPKIVAAIIKDYLLARKYKLHTEKTIFISDCRFGFFKKNAAKNIFLTHQLDIHHSSQWVAWLFRNVNNFFIKKFDELWIPDLPDYPGLAGKLSHPKYFPIKYKYIGPLSRLSNTGTPQGSFILVIISGPEPKRSRFEDNLLAIIEKLPDVDFVMIRGTTTATKAKVLPNLKVFDLVSVSVLNDLVSAAEKLISRAGYTSLMDYYHMRKEAMIIPTRGQSEQEYLGQLHALSSQWTVVDEGDLSLESIIEFLEQ